jgi:hypothetical protein
MIIMLFKCIGSFIIFSMIYFLYGLICQNNRTLLMFEKMIEHDK